MAKMPEAEKKILEEVEYLTDKYFTYDLPVPFEGLQIFPVTVQNYAEFINCSACLLLNKNDDPEGFKKTHLDYLYSKLQKEGQEGAIWSMKFSRIIELCLHVPNGFKCDKCGKIMTFEEYYSRIEKLQKQEKETQIAVTAEDVQNLYKCDCEQHGTFVQTLSYKNDETTGKKGVFIIDGHTINHTNFNRLRKFILHQNLPDYKDDSWVDKAIRDDQAALAEIKGKDQGEASLERKIIGLSVYMGVPLPEIYKYTTRKFLQSLSMIDDQVNYETTRLGLMTGMVSMKEGSTIEHWLYKKKDSSMYGGPATSVDSFVGKIQGA